MSYDPYTNPQADPGAATDVTSTAPGYYPAPAQPYYQQPVVVNVVQQNGYRPVALRPVNHWAHFWASFFTSGLWIPVWVHAVRKRRRIAGYR